MRAAVALLSAALTSAVAVAACSPSSRSEPAGEGAEDSGAGRTFGGARPTKVRVPAGYDAKKPAPLLVMLHGYGTAGSLLDFYIKMSSIADAKGFLLVAPDGTFDSKGKRFWNATDACCNYDGSTVDDVAYVAGLVDEIKGAYSVDPARIYVMGHSNGGFMAGRLACDRADLFAAAVDVSGAAFADASRCKPSAPVAFLQIHGTTDATILYAGASADAGAERTYPSAEASVSQWAEKNGCGADRAFAPPMHVAAGAAGAETKVSRHAGCAKNGAAELWAVEGAGHLFSFTPEALEATWAFLEAHAKPR
ncbi:MAG: alpha/beta fold hydrolase [Myxococcales bacterium]|jgi:polyhydroxybutyrate depolymerase|nr:alpha/beta fold hydrolase [Myxococcales bacterium]